jgi:hypothetical protein
VKPSGPPVPDLPRRPTGPLKSTDEDEATADKRRVDNRVGSGRDFDRKRKSFALAFDVGDGHRKAEAGKLDRLRFV